MIDVMFQKGSDLAWVRIQGNTLKFSKVKGGYLLWSNIDRLKFGVAGVLKEFPDLKGKENKEILEIGKERFKEHISKMKTEDEIRDYIMKDLSSHGYKPKYHMKKGHRSIKCH